MPLGVESATPPMVAGPAAGPRAASGGHAANATQAQPAHERAVGTAHPRRRAPRGVVASRRVRDGAGCQMDDGARCHGGDARSELYLRAQTGLTAGSTCCRAPHEPVRSAQRGGLGTRSARGPSPGRLLGQRSRARRSGRCLAPAPREEPREAAGPDTRAAPPSRPGDRGPLARRGPGRQRAAPGAVHRAARPGRSRRERPAPGFARRRGHACGRRSVGGRGGVRARGRGRARRAEPGRPRGGARALHGRAAARGPLRGLDGCPSRVAAGDASRAARGAVGDPGGGRRHHGGHRDAPAGCGRGPDARGRAPEPDAPVRLLRAPAAGARAVPAAARHAAARARSRAGPRDARALPRAPRGRPRDRRRGRRPRAARGPGGSAPSPAHQLRRPSARAVRVARGAQPHAPPDVDRTRRLRQDPTRAGAGHKTGGRLRARRGRGRAGPGLGSRPGGRPDGHRAGAAAALRERAERRAGGEDRRSAPADRARQLRAPDRGLRAPGRPAAAHLPEPARRGHEPRAPAHPRRGGLAGAAAVAARGRRASRSRAARALGGDPPLLPARGRRRPGLRPECRQRPRPSRRSAGDSTACRWRSSWPRRARPPCRPSRSASAWATRWRCCEAAAARASPGSRPCAPPSSGATTS